MAKTLTDEQCASIYAEAHEAGMEAVKELERENAEAMMTVNGYSGHYPVCGFAWIQVRPANCKFGKWLREQNLGRLDTYEGGVRIWVGYFNQSFSKKGAYAGAFADVLRIAGIKATSHSRLD